MSGFSDFISTNSPILPIPPSVACFDCGKSHPGLGVLMFLGVFSSPITLERLYIWPVVCLVLGFGGFFWFFFPNMVLVYQLLMRMGFFFHTWVF